MIELKDVTKSYNGKVIFEDVNLKLVDGTYSKADRMDRIHALAKDFFVESMLDKPMKNLSKGTV